MADQNDFTPKPGTLKIGGLSRKAQKLQALRDKAAAQANPTAAKAHAANSNPALKANALGHKKTSFNRKAV
ncbi:MAG: hypothetical protein M3O02_06200 [Acidobacteriota bacterium]|nr:hypothetical protein [Acidobacteriota bacterium]